MTDKYIVLSEPKGECYGICNSLAEAESVADEEGCDTIYIVTGMYSRSGWEKVE